MIKSKQGSFCILGFPDDLGVKNVNGRLGAAEGPPSFLKAFTRLKGSSHLLSIMQEPVMVPMGDDLTKNHENAVQEVVRVYSGLGSKDCLIVVGGGHDYAYPWIRGIAEAKKDKRKKIACINLDAHFDLREYEPIMTSGSPFRRLIDEKHLQTKNLIEFGIQQHCNSDELFQYVKKNKIKTIPFEKLRNGKAVSEFKKNLQSLSKLADEVYISLDLDSLSFAFCPGVSAPQAEGFTASELFQMLEIAGSNQKVKSLGVFELSPPLDVQDFTSRLAAQAVWHFLSSRYST